LLDPGFCRAWGAQVMDHGAGAEQVLDRWAQGAIGPGFACLNHGNGSGAREGSRHTGHDAGVAKAGGQNGGGWVRRGWRREPAASCSVRAASTGCRLESPEADRREREHALGLATPAGQYRPGTERSLACGVGVVEAEREDLGSARDRDIDGRTEAEHIDDRYDGGMRRQGVEAGQAHSP